MPLLGARIERRENLVAAWFGPKGFASVVYASSYSRPGRHRARRYPLLAAVVERDIGGERGPLLGDVTAAALMRYFLAAGDQA
ncbi:hypothetical protein GCM10010493_74880 [Streptomyces lavendulae subsp. grasserius]